MGWVGRGGWGGMRCGGVGEVRWCRKMGNKSEGGRRSS